MIAAETMTEHIVSKKKKKLSQYNIYGCNCRLYRSVKAMSGGILNLF